MNSNKEEYFISLGFAETPIKGDFEYENFPSKIGGNPVWLTPPDLEDSAFNCKDCKGVMHFLLQLYCPLEGLKHSFHRTVYVFFCKECWKVSNGVKVFRVQEPEVSQYYKSDQPLERSSLTKANESANSKLATLSTEYLIDTSVEKSEASRNYIKFYDKLDERSMRTDDDDDDDDYIVDHPSISDEKMDIIINRYYKDEAYYRDESNQTASLEDELECDIVSKLQNNMFKNIDDIFYDVFSKVLSYDPKQIVRYCRDDFFPLWFSNAGMLTVKNSKCKHCGSDLIFEFQVNKI